MGQEPKNANQTPELSVGDQIKVRREKLAQLQAEGHDPFQLTKFVCTSNAEEIKAHFDEMEGKPVSIAGRMMSKRVMGKFANTTRMKVILGTIGLIVIVLNIMLLLESFGVMTF